MEALLTVFTILISLVTLAGLSATAGVDSRDGFVDDRLRTSFR